MSELIMKYAGEMIEENCEAVYNEISEHEEVSKVLCFGDSGQYVGYKWYGVYNQEGIEDFSFYMKWN
jgi:hypothetical protein